MSNPNTNNVRKMNELLSKIKNELDNQDYLKTQPYFEELKKLQRSYSTKLEANQQTLQNKNINYTLRDQNLSLEQRENILNTRMKQLEIANERNSRKKIMLTIFISINVVVILLLVILLSVKFMKKNK